MVETVLGATSRAGELEAARRRQVALSLIETSAYPTATFGRAYERELANPAWRSLFGDAALDPQLVPHIQAVLGASESVHVRELAIAAAHRLVYCAVTVRAARGSLGAPVGAIVICEEITDEVMSRKLGVDPSVLICSGLVGADADYCNAAWQVRGAQSWREAVHAGDLDRCIRGIGQASNTRTPVELEARILRGTQPRWHRILITIEGSRWFLAAHDLAWTSSEERAELLAASLAARADAELANQRKDQFLATVSHELRTPVTTMLLWEKILRDAVSDAPLRAQALDAIHDSAVAQARLVGDLLDLARATSGKLHVDLRVIDIHRIVAEALAGSASEARGVRVEAPSGVGPVLVQGDAFRVRQILDNVLSNAVKFTDRGGRISVAITSTAQSVSVVINDSGRGIAAELLHRLFEPFSQSDDGYTRSEHGLGLGLGISKQLVELQSGTLTAESPGPGRGSTFTITLPAAGGASSPMVAPGPPKIAPHRIVLVDDDRRVLDALSLLLERAGATVMTAESAAAARRVIAASDPDLLLCDIAMPGEDGYTLISQLRASGVRIPAIALTAHAMESDAARSLAAGFDAHVTKPIDFEKLVAKIARLVADTDQIT